MQNRNIGLFNTKLTMYVLQVHSIFLNLGVLFTYNVILLNALVHRLTCWSLSQGVADAFLLLVRPSPLNGDNFLDNKLLTIISFF